MNLDAYRKLIQSFLSHELSPLEFEAQYLTRFKEEPHIPSPEIYEILNRLFSDVDAFCSDPRLRHSGDLDEAELRQCAERAYAELMKFN
jgi:hypothetical protein